MKKIIFFFLIILIVFSNTRTSFAADTTKYYFTWQDTAGGYKMEREVIGKIACEAERASSAYPIKTECYTTSKQVEIDAFNKTSGDFKFTWQMDNFISKEIRKGGGDTSILCGLDRTGKIADLDANQLKNWKNTKLCTDLRGATDPYYFNWQDPTTQMKSEVSFVNKKDCEAERINKKYTNSTVCYTPSKQTEIQAFNQARVVDGQNTKNFEEDYTLLAPIGNTTKIDGTTKIGDYLNTLLLIAIGLCGALAVIMIVIYGVQYMGDESVFGKTEAKSHIMAAIMGLLLALGAYAILNTINPNLVGKGDGGGLLTFNSVNIELTSGQEYRLAETQARDQNFRKTKYYDDVKKYVASVNYSSYGYTNKIHHCMAQVAIQRETNGNPALIGHDEDAPYTSIPSRVAFVQSGKKQSGAIVDKVATDKTLFNDDHIGTNIHTYPTNAAFLGLDWRFSHGIGLMQVTFFPNKYPIYNVGYNTAVTGKGISVKEMLNPNNAIQAGVEHLQFNFKQCGGNVEKAYRAYGGGGCDSTNSFSVKEAALRKNLYDQCVAQDK